MMPWYIEKGPESDVVISSRIRLARNLSEYPFSLKQSSEDETKVLNRVKEAAMSAEGKKMCDFLFVDIPTLHPIEKQVLVEKHLISPDLAESSRKNGALISRDEHTSIMVNEEDHVRIQCLFSGMQLENAWKLCNSVDDLLEKKLNYAFDQRYGYLTCCPTNVGTGLRASVMVHLPALVMTGYIKSVLEACGKLGVAVRGLYGENSEMSGNMFQISNQVTLGATEKEIITGVKGIASQIIEQERTLRKELYKQNSYRIEDRVFRSYGLFSNARILSSEESNKLLSDVRLGIDMGIITDISSETLNEIMLLIQPANLQKLVGKPLDPDERDVKRAEVIRSRLGKAKLQ